MGRALEARPHARPRRLKDRMNKELASGAIKAVTDPAFESRKGFCSRLVREVVASAYGDRYQDLFGPSALATAGDFEQAGLTVDATPNPDPGDILFKTSGAGPFGHVGIFTGDKGVAENSSTSIGRVQGAKGYRSLAQFGPFQSIGRLPGLADAGHYTLFLNGQQVAVMPVRDGHALCPVRQWADALGFQVDYDAGTGQVLLEGQPVASATIDGGTAYAPIAGLAASAGLKLAADEGLRRVTVSR